MFESKGVIYQLHFQLLKVASIKNSPTLRQKVSVWMDHSDMLVSTAFDIEHFEAQIRDRTARGLTQFVPGLQQTLGEVQARHDAALAAIEVAENEMEEAYVELVPEGNKGRTRAELRKVFEEKIRGPKRPKKLPKPKRQIKKRARVEVDVEVTAALSVDTGPVLLESDLEVVAEFGKPPQGPGRMRLTVN